MGVSLLQELAQHLVGDLHGAALAKEVVFDLLLQVAGLHQLQVEVLGEVGGCHRLLKGLFRVVALFDRGQLAVGAGLLLIAEGEAVLVRQGADGAVGLQRLEHVVRELGPDLVLPFPGGVIAVVIAVFHVEEVVAVLVH